METISGSAYYLNIENPPKHTAIFAGLIRLQEVLKANESEDYKVTVRKLDTSEKNYVNLFKELKEKDEVKLVIDCDVYRVKEILHQVNCILISLSPWSPLFFQNFPQD